MPFPQLFGVLGRHYSNPLNSIRERAFAHTNPPLGVFCTGLGAWRPQAYVPYRRVKTWSWQTYWVETQMGRFKFSSWTMHMASIIIFSTLWGIALKEWKGAGKRTKLLVALSLLVLVGSTMIVGYGNCIGKARTAT